MPKPEMFQATAQGGEKDSNNACSGSVSRLEADCKPQERHDQNPSSDPQETAEHPGRDAAKAEQQPNHHFLHAPVAEPALGPEKRTPSSTNSVDGLVFI